MNAPAFDQVDKVALARKVFEVIGQLEVYNTGFQSWQLSLTKPEAEYLLHVLIG